MKREKKNILVVDDNPVNRRLIIAILEAEGYSTSEAANGHEALDVLGRHTAVAVISDILMPIMDGYRFCYELRTGGKYTTIPFIFLTATYTSPNDEKLAIEIGADKILKKPISAREVVATLDEVLSNPVYNEPRLITHPRTIEVIEGYRDALVAKLEEKTVELQRAVESLSASEELFRVITESAADLIAVLDLKGKRLYSSPSYRAFFGDPDKLKGTDSFREIHRDDRERIKEVFRQTVMTGVGQRAEYRLVLPDGSVRHVESQGSLVRGLGGLLEKVVVVSRDITERKEAEAAFRESEQRYRLLFQSNPHPMWFFDAETLSFLDVNEAAIKHYGYEREEFLSMTIRDIRPPDDVPKLLDDLAQQHRGFDVAGQWRHKKKDGAIIIVEITSHEIKFSGRKAKVVLAHDITRRVNAEGELRKLSSAVEQAGDSILITTKEGVIEYVNPAFESTTGYAKEFAMGKTPRILKSGNQDAGFYSGLWATISAGKVFRDIVVNKKVNGELYYEEQTITPIVDASGNIVHFVSTGRDITERKRTEEVLLESERRFREMLENVQLIAMTLDAKGSITFCNDYLLQLTGWRRDEVLNTDWFTKFIPGDARHVQQLFFEAMAHSTIPSHYENPIKTRTGALRQIRWNNTILRDTAGNVIGTASIGEDITDRAIAERVIRESEERFRQLTDAIKEVFWLTNPEKNEMLYISSAYEEIWGRTRDSLYAQPLSWAEAIHPDDRNRIIEDARAQQVEGTYDSVYRIVRPDGSVRWIHDRAFPVKDEAGKVNRMAGVAEDITERRSLEDQLRQAQKLESLGTLAGGVAHDFNNILSIIMGHASLLGNRKREAEKFDKSIDAIIRASQRGAGLVRQLLTFARKAEPTTELVNVNDMVMELVKLFEETFPKTIRISLLLDKAVPPIFADGNQLHQAMLNLCVNARDAMSETGTMTLSTAMVAGDEIRGQATDIIAERYVLISVQDTGSGMDEKTLQQIFVPFFTTKGIGKGTGLGLAVVYGIVNNLRGYIDVESAPGAGTTFRILLPAITKETAKALTKETVQRDVPGGTETVLLVEDEEMLMDLLATLLEAKGYRVLKARDGDEALEVYKKNAETIALVLADLGLPKRDGYSAFQEMQQMTPKVKGIISTGYIDTDRRAAIFASGVRDIMMKPYIPLEVLRRVREVIDED